jgi:hypothetical protein
MQELTIEKNSNKLIDKYVKYKYISELNYKISI